MITIALIQIIYNMCVPLEWTPPTDTFVVDHYDLYEDGTFLKSTPDTTPTTDICMEDLYTDHLFSVVAIAADGTTSVPSDTTSIQRHWSQRMEIPCIL